MFAPLTGIRVVDCTHVLAGPYCTQLLAHLGAEVTKVEPVGLGDMTRHGGPIAELNAAGLGLAFCTQNTDKASIAVDLKHAEGVEVVRRLAARADVFVENFRPGVIDRLGLGWADLAAGRDDLVYLSISAYGQDGPIGHRPAYDHVVQAMSGIMETTGTDETGPVKVGAPFVDYGTGLKAAMATLAAILEQRRTACSQRIDVAMLDSALLLMASTLTATAASGERPPKLGNEAASGNPASGTFATSDGLLAIAANTDRQFLDLGRALDLDDLADDDRFADGAARRHNRVALRAHLAERLATAPADEWERRLDAHGVPASRVRSLDETLAGGQPAARGLLATVPVGATSVEVPTAGFKANGQVPGPRRPPSQLGADAEQVLTAAGYDPDEIAALIAAGAVGPPPPT